MAMDPTQLVRTELINASPAEGLANLLDVAVPTETVPPLWHWIYLLEKPRQSDIGPDGHPLTSVPAPPGPGRKRMFAGGRVTTYEPLLLGYEATKTTSVTQSVEKVGKSGPMTFVTVRVETRQADRVKIVEENDIVYRAAGSALKVQAGTLADVPVASAAGPSLTMRVDESTLFRFSALTYNAHRIHYDHRWAEFEGYPGLVIHGPLQALMMGELARRSDIDLVGRVFSYRLVSPMVGPQVLTVIGDNGETQQGFKVLDVHGNTTAISTLAAI